MNRALDPLRNRYSEGVGEASKGDESDVAGAEPPRMEPLKEPIAIKARHRSLKSSNRELLARVAALGASLRPTPVVRLVHPRLNLFAKLGYNNVAGSLKVSVTPTALLPYF